MPKSLAYFKALADETRLRLINVLCRHELNVNELVQLFEMGQSRISRHLKILTEAGLLTWRRDGLWVFYSAPSKGEGLAFINAMLPFMANEPLFMADVNMAASMIEERVHTTQQFFNNIAEDWDKLSREVLGQFDLARAVTSHLTPCAVAADLGCGTGNVLSALLEHAQSVIGVDGSPRMLELARRRLLPVAERVSLRIGDLAHLPLRDGETDFACLNMVLHHLPAPIEALAEIHRVLTPTGTLVLTDFATHSDERMRADYGDRWLGFDAETLRSYLRTAGFSVITHTLAPVERGLALHIFVAQQQPIKEK